jgi:hypothetical protein
VPNAKLLEAFVRVRDGEWFCRASVTVEDGAGPFTFTPGVTYRRGETKGGMDIVLILEQVESFGTVPPHLIVSS